MRRQHQRRRVLGLWILGFVTFLVSLNVGYVMLKLVTGTGSPFTPYLIGHVVGSIDPNLYLAASLTVAFLGFGGTAWLYAQQDPQSINVEILEVLDRLLTVTQNAVKTEGESTQRIQVNLVETRDTLAHAIQQLHEVLDTGIETLQQAHAEAFQRQETFVRLMLKTVDTALLPPKPRISGSSSPIEVKGIGPQTSKELTAMGITTVDEFLIADPSAIGRQTRLSPDQAKRMQDTIQLLMVPEIDDTDVELLARVDVANRKDLADQDQKRIVEVIETIGEN